MNLMKTHRSSALLLTLLVAAPATAAGDIRFNRDIRPILSNRCFKCHGPDLKKGGLNLQARTPP